MIKYLKVMDGIKSNANGFEYKIDEVNVADTWNPNSTDPKEMGGFNFSTEDKILRWIHRGNTIYDVVIPVDAQIIDCPSESCPHGVFRSNKIIIRNPKKVTEDMVFSLYEKSNLPIKSYYECIIVMLYRNYINVSKKIIEDKINKNNINDCIKEFERFITDKYDGNTYEFKYDDLWKEAKEIYNILKDIERGK